MLGTLTTYDLIATRFQYANERLSDIGEEDAYKAIAELLADHNIIMRQLMGDLVAPTTQRDDIYGSTDVSAMFLVDEMGTAPPTKVVAGSVVGFPLKRFEKAWQGSKKWLQRATMGELLGQVDAMRDSDRVNMIREVKLAMFNGVNYTWNDYLVDHRTNPLIAVKALANADGMPIPPGPNGEIFDPTTHTHYLGTSSLVTSDVVSLKETVLEHFGTGGTFVISIARAQEAAVRAMTPNFVATLNVGLVGPTTAVQLPGMTLALTPTGARQIGEFDGIPVWVKPWMPSSYLACYETTTKVLRRRVEDDLAGAGDLAIDAQDEDHPLRAETYSREFGLGVYNRVGCAILYTGNATYAAPSL